MLVKPIKYLVIGNVGKHKPSRDQKFFFKTAAENLKAIL